MSTYFSKIITDFYEKIHTFDVKTSRQIYNFTHHYTILLQSSKALTFLVDYLNIICFVLYVIFKLPNPCIFIPTTIAGQLIHEYGIKKLFKRNRPKWKGIDGFSFPSSHSFSSGMLFIFSFLYPTPFREIFLGLSIIIPPTRVMLGYHYIADTVAGFTLGFVFALILRFFIV